MTSKPSLTPNLVGKVAGDVLGGVARSVFAGPTQPSAHATSTSNEHDSFLTWEQLLTLLQAKHNPRFCKSNDEALQYLAGGKTGDCIAMMGALPHVAHEAGIPDKMQHLHGMLPGQDENKPEHMVLWTNLRRGTGKDLVNVLEQLIPDTTQQAEFAAMFGAKLRQALEDGIVFASHSKSPQLVMVMVNHKYEFCDDYGTGYALGNTGSAPLPSRAGAYQETFISTEYKAGMAESAVPRVAKEVLGAMLRFARQINLKQGV